VAGEAGAYLGSRVLVAEEGEGVAGGNGQPDGGGDGEDDVVGLAQLGAVRCAGRWRPAAQVLVDVEQQLFSSMGYPWVVTRLEQKKLTKLAQSIRSVIPNLSSPRCTWKPLLPTQGKPIYNPNCLTHSGLIH